MAINRDITLVLVLIKYVKFNSVPSGLQFD